jgi:hypothetical protein
MTPTAVTPAARTKRSGGSGTKRPSSPHPSTPRPAHRGARASATAPSAPRRVSGPARPAAARTATPARTAAPTRTATPARTARPRRKPAPSLPLSTRALAFARTLPDHRLLDRLVRGRLWIPLLGLLLIGIVASQVEILKLNASLGHGVVRAAQLQSQDERLASAVSQLSDTQHIEAQAAHMGMAMPAAYTPVFLSGGRGELRRALANIHRPDPAAFQSRAAALAAQRAAAVQSSTGQ